MSKSGRERARGGAREPSAPGGSPPDERRARHAIVQAQCLEDLQYWVETDARVARKLVEFIRACLRDPFTGLGKPEPLKALGPNVWSRRITQADRLVYVVYDDRIDFLQARYHY